MTSAATTKTEKAGKRRGIVGFKQVVVPIGYGELDLDLTALGNSTLYVTDIKINIFNRSESKAR